MNKKRLIITSVISIVLVSILMIGSTYSVFTSQDVDEELNVYKTGNLNITYAVGSDSVTFTNNTPLNIEQADTVTPYRITVTNNGTTPYMFDLILEDTTASNVVDYQYIMTKVGYLEPKSLSSCDNNIIKDDIILLPEESVDIDVRIWLSDTISNTEIGKSFFAKLKVDGLAIYDKNEKIDNSILSLNYMKGFSSSSDTSYFHSSTYQEKVKNVSFVNYIDTSSAVESWDMSNDGNNSIMAWITNNETSGYYDLYIGSTNEIYAKDLSNFFYYMTAVDSISFNNLNTSLTANMRNMFNRTGYNSTVFTLDLGDKFDTSKVTNTSYMFSQTGYNSTIFTLNLGDKFDTTNVTDMQGMFYNTGYSSTIFTLDLGDKFDTSKVTTMYYMFSKAGYNSTIFTLDLGDKFDTTNVTNMRQMFEKTGYSNTMFTLDLGDKFDTSKVTDMYSMFSQTGYSSTVFNLDLGDKFNTTNVTNMGQMFYQAGYSNTVLTLDLGDKFDTSKVNDMSYMFYKTGYRSTEITLDLGDKFNTTKVTNMSYMFYSTGYLNSNLVLDLSTFTFDNVTSYSNMFYGFSTTKTIYVKDSTAQSWILDKGFSNLSTTNVLIK